MDNDIPEESPAGQDIDMFPKYHQWCQENRIPPSIDGYVLWLDEHDKSLS